MQGQLVDRAGHGTAGRLLVLAWPPSDLLAAVRVGHEARTLPVAKGLANANGQFVLRADPKAPIAEFAEANGTLNFTLVAEAAVNGDAPGERLSFAFSRRLEGGAAGGRWSDPNGDGGGTADVTLTTAGSFGSLKAMDEPLVPAPANKDGGCPNYVRATYDQRPVIIGETYNGPNNNARFFYEASSESTLGVGASASGASGSYRASGTSTRSNTSKIDFPKKYTNVAYIYKTSYQYKKFEIWVLWPEMGCIKWNYEARPTAFQGAAGGYVACCKPAADQCSNITQIGAVLWKETASAVTFSNGVTISGFIGIDLSSKTGWTTKTKVGYDFVRAGKLCGSDGTAWPDAARVVGK